MNKLILYFGLSLVLLSVGLFFLSGYVPQINNRVLVQPATVSVPEIIAPAVKTFNILLIPGHNPKDGGGNYRDIYERDLVLNIAQEISNILGKNEKYKIVIARDNNDWNLELKNYFEKEKENIIAWKTQRQNETKALLAEGVIKEVPDMAMHSEVTPETSVRLYGTNKWANENNINLVLNLHFNDSIRPNMNLPGTFKGFTIFVPESQLKNSEQSYLVATEIFNEIKKVEPPQINNLLEDQSLIALGASNTLNAPSAVIEYAYIYEKQIPILKMAQATATGIENYVSQISQASN